MLRCNRVGAEAAWATAICLRQVGNYDVTPAPQLVAEQRQPADADRSCHVRGSRRCTTSHRCLKQRLFDVSAASLGVQAA